MWTNQQLESKRGNILRKKKEEYYNACANSWDRISILFSHHQGIWTTKVSVALYTMKFGLLRDQAEDLKRKYKAQLIFNCSGLSAK